MKRIAVAAGLALAALVPATAFANTDLSIGVGLGGYAAPPPPVYYRPAPTYYYPAAPVYYGPTVRYRYYDRDDYWRWRRHEWREHHRWEDRDGWHDDD